MRTVVINIFGAPGAGKSSFAALIFSEMKRQGLSAELVTEVAKDLVYRDDFHGLKMQLPVAGVQYERVQRLVGRVHFVATDSPVLLSAIYAPPDYPRAFHDLMVWAHQSVPAINAILPLVETRYRPEGRIHSLKQATQLDREIAALVRKTSARDTILVVRALTIASARRVMRRAQALSLALNPAVQVEMPFAHELPPLG